VASASVKQSLSLESGADGESKRLTRFLQAKIWGQRGNRGLKTKIAH
jgi:hypothetical protein